MDKEIRVGDWVFLDDEDDDNRMYHEVFQERYSLVFNKKYLVVMVCNDIVYLEGVDRPYACFTRRVRLANPTKEVTLWE